MLKKKEEEIAGCQWLTPVILATREDEIMIQGQSEQIVLETLSPK
jgi:hypothetical protein